MKSKNRSEIIREVLAEFDFTLSNKQLKDIVRERYSLNIESNEIGNIGSYRSRLAVAGHSKYLLDKAKDFLVTVGDDKLAISLLRLVSND